MNNNQKHVIFLYDFFKLEHKTVKAIRNINAAFVKDVINKLTTWSWFLKIIISKYEL